MEVNLTVVKKKKKSKWNFFLLIDLFYILIVMVAP